MNKNVGGLDRQARFVVGIILAVAGIAAVLEYWAIGVTIGAVAILVAAILLVTGTTQKCPLNEVAGINTAEE